MEQNELVGKLEKTIAKYEQCNPQKEISFGNVAAALNCLHGPGCIAAYNKYADDDFRSFLRQTLLTGGFSEADLDSHLAEYGEIVKEDMKLYVKLAEQIGDDVDVFGASWQKRENVSQYKKCKEFFDEAIKLYNKEYNEKNKEKRDRFRELYQNPDLELAATFADVFTSLEAVIANHQELYFAGSFNKQLAENFNVSVLAFMSCILEIDYNDDQTKLVGFLNLYKKEAEERYTSLLKTLKEEGKPAENDPAKYVYF